MSRELFGSGHERNVFIDPDHPERLVKEPKKEKHESPLVLRGIFHLTKILHQVLPEHVPDVHRVELPTSRITVERRHLSPQAEEARAARAQAQQEKRKMNSKERATLFRAMAEVQAVDFSRLTQAFTGLGVSIDSGGYGNIVPDADGHMVYVDNLEPWFQQETLIRNYNPEAIQQALANLPQREQSIVAHHLSQLEIAYEEARKMYEGVDR